MNEDSELKNKEFEEFDYLIKNTKIDGKKVVPLAEFPRKIPSAPEGYKCKYAGTPEFEKLDPAGKKLVTDLEYLREDIGVTLRKIESKIFRMKITAILLGIMAVGLNIYCIYQLPKTFLTPFNWISLSIVTYTTLMLMGFHPLKKVFKLLRSRK